MTKKTTPEHVKDLIPDPENRRKHTPRTVGLLVDALQKVGAARSIVIDEDGVILAGNATVEAAAEAGITNLKVVEATGNEVVAVRRTGLTDDQKRDLAIYDNRTSELAEWDVDQLMKDVDAGIDLSAFFREDELAVAIGKLPDDMDWSSAMGGLAKDSSGFQEMVFTLTDAQVETVKRALDSVQAIDGEATGNPNKNGNALAFVCAKYVS